MICHYKYIVTLIIYTYFICFNNYIFSQNVYYPQNPATLANSLDLAIQSNNRILFPVYIHISIRDAQNEPYVIFNTPFFELQTNNILISTSQFREIYFSVGNKEKLHHPPDGKYNIEATLINNSNQQKISQTLITIWIDSVSQSNEKKFNKPGFLIQNTNEVNLPDDTLNSFMNFNRTDINGTFSISGIPLRAGLGVTTLLFQKETYIDNFTISVDRDEILRQLQEKSQKAYDGLINSSDTAGMRKLINESYTSYTNVSGNWYDMINTYKNDSVKKIVQQIQNLDSNKLAEELNTLGSQTERLEYQIDSLKNKIHVNPDALSQGKDSIKAIQKKVNEYNNLLSSKRKQITSLQNQSEQLDKYKNIIQNKNILDTLTYKDPQKILEQYLNTENLYKHKLLEKQMNILKNLKKFDVGLCNINWSNQAASFLRLNGLNVSYDINRFNISAFAGISADRNSTFFLLKKDSIIEYKFGLNIAYAIKDKQVINIYNLFSKNKESATLDSTYNHSYTSSGVTYNYIFSKQLDILLESGISKNLGKSAEKDLQYLFSGKVRFQSNNTLLSTELLYKSKDYRANNYFVTPFDNIISNTQFSQKILREKLQFNLQNIFTKNFFPEENNYNNVTNNLNFSINYYPNKTYFILLSTNFFHADNNINEQKDVQYTATLTNGYNRKIKKALHLSLSQSIQYSYRLSNYFYSHQSPILELSALNYQEGEHINMNINASLNFKENQTVSSSHNLLFIQLPDTENSSTTQQYSQNIVYNVALKSYTLETGFIYMRTIRNSETTHSYAPAFKIQGNFIKNLTLGLQYQYFKNQIFLYQGSKDNNHLLRVNVSYKI